MSEALVRFIEATMSQRLNDLDNPHNLPGLLSKVEISGHKLVPLQATDWSLGQLGGEEGALVAKNVSIQWWQYLISRKKEIVPEIDPKLFAGKPLPTDALPRLSTPSVTVTGLDNVELGPLGGIETLDAGYGLTVPLVFGLHKGSPLPETVILGGRYQLDQAVCAVDKGGTEPTKQQEQVPSPLSWPIDHVRGSGDFALTVTDLAVDATLRVLVAGAGPDRTLRVEVQHLKPRGESGGTPVYVLDDKKLSIDQQVIPELKAVWLDAVTEAFRSKEAGTALTEALTTSLNDTKTLASIGQSLTERLGQSLDSTFGSVPHGSLAEGGPSGNNPADQYLFDRLRTSVADETSAFYPPTVVLSMTDPEAEPYVLKEVDLGDIKLPGDWGTLEKLVLTDVTVVGCSNIVVPPEAGSLADGRVKATASLSTLTGKPRVPNPPLRATGALTCTYGGEADLPGTFVIEASRAALACELSFAGQDLDHLAITFESLLVHVASEDFTLTVDLSDGSGHPAVEDVVNAELKKPAMKDQISERVNTAVTGERQRIGAEVSGLVRRIVAERLDKADSAAEEVVPGAP